MLKKQNYEFVLHTLAPVHIGSGVKATSKEFIQENGEYYFPEMDKLYLFLEKIILNLFLLLNNTC